MPRRPRGLPGPSGEVAARIASPPGVELATVSWCIDRGRRTGFRDVPPGRASCPNRRWRRASFAWHPPADARGGGREVLDGSRAFPLRRKTLRTAWAEPLGDRADRSSGAGPLPAWNPGAGRRRSISTNGAAWPEPRGRWMSEDRMPPPSTPRPCTPPGSAPRCHPTPTTRRLGPLLAGGTSAFSGSPVRSQLAQNFIQFAHLVVV